MGSEVVVQKSHYNFWLMNHLFFFRDPVTNQEDLVMNGALVINMINQNTCTCTISGNPFQGLGSLSHRMSTREKSDTRDEPRGLRFASWCRIRCGAGVWIFCSSTLFVNHLWEEFGQNRSLLYYDVLQRWRWRPLSNKNDIIDRARLSEHPSDSERRSKLKSLQLTC